MKTTTVPISKDKTYLFWIKTPSGKLLQLGGGDYHGFDKLIIDEVREDLHGQ